MRKRIETERIKRGGYCQNNSCAFLCWILEFAHLRMTDCHGKSRGRNRRILDIGRHASAYALLCQECHRLFDAGQELVLIIRHEAHPIG